MGAQAQDGDVYKGQADKLDKQLKARIKPLKNEPFIKNLFCGTYVYDYFKYPEFEETRQVDKLNNVYVAPVREYLSTTSKTKIQSGTNFTPEALDCFRQLGLFGQSIVRQHGGLEMDSTSVARLIEECSANGYTSLAMQLIYANEVAAKSVQMFGNHKQQTKYLGRLASGELRAGFGFSELRTGIDASRFDLIATRGSSSGSSYILNGEKCWVSLLTSTAGRKNNGDFVLIVVAKTVEPENQFSLTAFIFDADTPGNFS